MTILPVLLLLLLGMFLSAFFSGSETGFYRATRTRLAMDARGGDLIAHGLIRLTNNPALFVATTLIGNNLANYVTSWAIVLCAARLSSEQTHTFELLAPILMSPIVFVYGELLPKNLFLHAPNRLLRLAGPLFLIFTILFLPLAGVLWVLARILQSFVGESPVRLQLTLARNELRRVFQEGHQAGVLSPAQQQLADGMIRVASEPVLRFCLPPTRVAAVHLGTAKADVLRIARRHKTSHVLVTEQHGHRWIGYVRVVDLCLEADEKIQNPRHLMKIHDNESPIAALTKMQGEKELIAQVLDAQDQTIGLLSARTLTDFLLNGHKGSGQFV